MEVELEDAGPLEKKLSITVPAKEVEGRFAVAYRELRKEVELPGFRKGKVPRKVLEKRFGERIAAEVALSSPPRRSRMPSPCTGWIRSANPSSTWER